MNCLKKRHSSFLRYPFESSATSVVAFGTLSATSVVAFLSEVFFEFVKSES